MARREDVRLSLIRREVAVTLTDGTGFAGVVDSYDARGLVLIASAERPVTYIEGADRTPYPGRVFVPVERIKFVQDPR